MIKKRIKLNLLKIKSFRLLNSEIGNDRVSDKYVLMKSSSFRLLNSEIGNDLKYEIRKREVTMNVFVSLTRR